MKKLVSLSMLIVMSFSLYAQDRDVTRFLGIPVDGSKKDMIQKLKAKGFENSDYEPNRLEGEFNGSKVEISVVTNNNKVWRIAVFDKIYLSKGDIKIRFNTLCQQFENNSKYTPVKEDQTIPEDEDIEYEITVNDKRYQAGFYQYNFKDLKENASEYAKSQLVSQYSQEELENPTPEIQSELSSKALLYLDGLLFNDDISVKKKFVWFMIQKHTNGRFFIAMYYDNQHNEANGEDL